MRQTVHHGTKPAADRPQGAGVGCMSHSRCVRVSCNSRAGSVWTLIIAGNGISSSVMSCSSPLRLVMDIDVAGLLRPLSTDADASSSRECTSGDAHDKGDSGDEINEISSRSPADLGDVINKGSRSTVSISKSERTRLGDSCTDDRLDTCDPWGLNGVNRAIAGEISEGTTEAISSSDLATLEFAEPNSPNRREGSMTQTPVANGTFESRPAAAGQGWSLLDRR